MFSLGLFSIVDCPRPSNLCGARPPHSLPFSLTFGICLDFCFVHLFFVSPTMSKVKDAPLRFPPMVTTATTDREALVALFQATNGDGWNRKDNWETNAELSQWHGVKVNEQDRVVELVLENNNLRGMYVCRYTNNYFLLLLLLHGWMDVLTSTKNPQTSIRPHGRGRLKLSGGRMLTPWRENYHDRFASVKTE